MDLSYTIYSLAIAWFTYTAFRMGVLLYQYHTFPATFGYMPKLSLRDLVEIAFSHRRDLPVFRVIVPAYNETDVIEGTMRRLARMNYPLSHFQVFITTYEDEPVVEGRESTTSVVRRVAGEINAEVRQDVFRSVVVPAGFDGGFPGVLESEERHIGKSRGLNYTLRSIHGDNERVERSFFIGRMIESGQMELVGKTIRQLGYMLTDEKKLLLYVRKYFSDKSKSFTGRLVYSDQLQKLLLFVNTLIRRNCTDSRIITPLVDYVKQQSPAFFLDTREERDPETGELKSLLTTVMEDKEFLFDVMQEVEALDGIILVKKAEKTAKILQQKHPFLFTALEKSDDSESVYQVSRKIGTRWVMVYDADADAPADVMRYLSARIMVEPGVMGFQGPVAPVLNYEEVHPLCRLGGLWMAFWHSAKYPRLMNKKQWAHPLAGTNWCFHIDGLLQEGRLIRECYYAEDRRKFLLNFDPKQLTEDLEAGIRIYSDWDINAEWHPVLEMEQVPPTPRALVVQRTRWTLGTLQTIGYILKSRIPVLQKIRFVFHPAEIMVNGSGPVIAISLFVALFAGWIVVDPIFAWWAIILTFGNLIYIYSFEKVYERCYDIRQRNRTMDYLYQYHDAVYDELEQGLQRNDPEYLRLLNALNRELEESLKPDGLAEHYYNYRCIDDEESRSFRNEVEESEFNRLMSRTRVVVRSTDIEQIRQRFAGLNNEDRPGRKPEKSHNADTDGQLLTAVPDKNLQNTKKQEGTEMIRSLIDVMYKHNELERSKGVFRWSRAHRQIALWTFPYIFFQLVPYFKGLFLWMRGGSRVWHKTARTPKPRPGSST